MLKQQTWRISLKPILINHIWSLSENKVKIACPWGSTINYTVAYLPLNGSTQVGIEEKKWKTCIYFLNAYKTYFEQIICACFIFILFIIFFTL